jgi:threonine/homoserine/homoserine lactone efflux protein
LPDASAWLVFVAASVALLVTPGPAVLYVVTRSLAEGRRLGLVSVAGIAAGTLGHVAAATLGLSAVLSSSELAFTIVKVAGAAYLVWVGVGRIVAGSGGGAASPAAVPSGAWATFRQGVIVNLLNPKTALFFLAFLPQFVDRRHAIGPQMLALGLTFAALGVTTDALYALLAGTVRRGLVRGDARRTVLLQRWLTGLVFIALGVTAAFTQPAA